MDYFSTRDSGHRVSASRAVAQGLAPDGGLYVPSELPRADDDTLRALCGMDYRRRAERIMAPFLPEYTAEEVRALAEASYGTNFDDPAIAPVHFADGRTGFLELWHGPTCAFKDMALQLLPRLLTAALKKCGETRRVCILVATSGDTGKAALEGFADVPGTKILVFYPRDGVSDVQKLQMITQRGGNVRVSAVAGNFDDAQTGVKTIFGDRTLAESLSARGWFLSSANSINWGRLLPQIVYYFSAYCDFVNAGALEMGAPMNFCVPTGNFGDILAGWYAARMGLPVGRLICASNANNVLTDFFGTGVYDRNRPFRVTTSPSMDILVSSNLERLLRHLSGSDAETAGYMASLRETGRYAVSPAVREGLRASFSAGWCGDGEALAAIGALWRERNYLMDPHTAVAWQTLRRYRERTGDVSACAVVSTASPFKFCDSVLRALGETPDAPGTALIGRLSDATGLPVPAPLAGLADRERRFGGCAERDGMERVVEEFLA
jgi:threonine synthase